MARAALLPLLLTGCTAINPAFNPVTAGTTGTTDPEAPTTTDATPTDPSTTTSPGDTTSAILPTTTTDVTTTTSDVTDTTAGADTGDTDPNPIGPCWDMPPDSWNLAPVELKGFKGGDPRDPALSADALRLYYIAGPPDARRPRVSARKAQGAGFPDGMPLATWTSSPELQPRSPRISLFGLELLLSINKDIYFAAFDPNDKDDTYKLPQQLGDTINTGFDEAVMSIDESGAILMVQRDDDIPKGYLPSSYKFYQFTRTTLEPGQPFSGGQPVTPYVPTLGFAMCPAMSPDAKHLFFTSLADDDFAEDNVSDRMRIYTTTRLSSESGWADPTRIDVIQPKSEVLCPTSISANGCSLTYTEIRIHDPAKAPKMYILERGL